ncbi:hypothetical protein [Kineosporia sp. NBRC 101731]|uniref:hypothetical protein n=1 Tax=Kineosporia sp. NBRC 101731 TaxID=3032199 RepID=UPI0024A270D0|nr:hypothetical protein [Kineosporia sp. NBRC 101731]GLY27429.1 hypothetical protein Kisp02_07940 [Kineosporia sp. NBRC 101731]
MRSTSGKPKNRGPLAKPCRTCTEVHPVGRLHFGQCPDCAHLVALPLRGEVGRFMSFTRQDTDTIGGAA